MKVLDIIPTAFLPRTDQEKGSKDPRRLTLLYKKVTGLVCLLSRGLGEVSFDKPVEDAIILRMFGPKNVSAAYESRLVFHERKLANDSYVTLRKLDDLNDRTIPKKIPFTRRDFFLSEFVQTGGLNTKIDELLFVLNRRLIVTCEEIADLGVLRGMNSKKVRDEIETYEKVGASIYSEVSGLFHEERESVPVRKHDFFVSDRSLDNYFDDPRPMYRRIKENLTLCGLVPIISLLPPSVPDILAGELKDKYEKRFSAVKDEQEQAAIALGEFAFCNPKLMSGLRRAYFEIKAMGNLGLYGIQAAANTYAICNFSPWVWVPLTIPTAITGITMARNAIRSGGQDYSGVIPTFLEKLIQYKLQD
jgi:hypothetical protein